MLETLTTPLRTMLFAMGGALLAWLWYHGNAILAVSLVLAIFVLVTGLQGYARSCITTNPLRALRLMETRLFGIGAASAAGAAMVIIVAVEFAPGANADPALKEIVTAATAALTAFITGMAISPEDIDEKIGDYVENEFQARFTDHESPGKMSLPKGSDALKAVFTSHEYGWTDWSKDKRQNRIKTLAEYLDSVPDSSRPGSV